MKFSNPGLSVSGLEIINHGCWGHGGQLCQHFLWFFGPVAVKCKETSNALFPFPNKGFCGQVSFGNGAFSSLVLEHDHKLTWWWWFSHSRAQLL